MSLHGSPPLISPGSGAPNPVALYRSASEHLHATSSSITTTTSSSSAPFPNNNSSNHSGSPRITTNTTTSSSNSSGMLATFLPGHGAPLSASAGALSALSGFGSLSNPVLTPSSQHQQSNLCSECKLVEVHGVKVASFSVDGQELICLPQVFDLFLKHLVGGLHTVYTKLKRLDITPVVCTVEQVRVLRGLGAIQPGVNRCKLISRNDFETLYQDCTSAR
ncbi:hypothetical protein WMY93_014690 [Mugilogobius chulae]|uniref:SKI/SNO/DAC domain-containing protein n=1 Tax=Mugilogobius chulae TaxID=88201 RepID=A0AAW0NV81_9GOBI